MLAAHRGGIEKIKKEAQVPHSLARLPLTAFATGAVLAGFAARAAEPAPSPAAAVPPPLLAYVLDGLEGPDLVTVPGAGLGHGIVTAPPPPPPPTLPMLPAVIRLASAEPLFPAPFAPAILADVVPPLPQAELAALPAPVPLQGPMPDGSTLNARLTAESELPPLDPAQPAVAEAQPSRRVVLSKLDGPGPLPAPPPPADPEPEEPDPAPDPPSPGTEGTESLTDAIIASLKGNPEIQISLAQQDDARFAVNEARAGYLPRIDVTGAWGREFARNIPQAATQRFRSEATVSLNQNLWDFGVTINDIKRARASYRSAQWGTRERIEAISYDIANAYLGVLLQQNLVALAEGEIASVKKILRIVTVQKDLGLTTAADVERAQTRLDNVRSQLLDRQSALEQARNAYKRLTDHMPLRAAEVPAAGSALPESADVAVDLIDTRSPRLAQAVEDRRSLDKQYDSQADTALPRLGLTIASDYRQDVLGATGRAIDARAMVTFSYRLYNGGAATATKHRIAARLRQADYELDRRRREVEQDIRVDYASLGAAREKIATIEAEISSAEKVADLYKQQFRGGRRTVFDLLDAEQLLFAARAKQTANQIALRAAEYRVLQKLGGLFDLVSGGQPLPDLVQPAPGSDE